MKKLPPKRGSRAQSNPPPKDVDDSRTRPKHPAEGSQNHTRPGSRRRHRSHQLSHPYRSVSRGLVAYAAYTNHCSLFPMSMAVIRKFGKEIKSFLASKGTIHFPLDQPLPPALLKKIVRARLAEKKQK